MTSGCIVILGEVGKNFGAGMSGGEAYVYDEFNHFHKLHNPELTTASALEEPGDITLVKSLIQAHLENTDSPKAKRLLDDWENTQKKYVKVHPSAPPSPPAYDEEKAVA